MRTGNRQRTGRIHIRVTPIAAVQWAFQLLYLFLLVRVILTWVPGVDQRHPAVQFVHRVTSPMLNPIRRLVPPVGGLDLSPLIAFVLLSAIQRVVVDVMVRAAYR